MAGIAAGLALSGKIPFIASYAMFSPGRNWEQIRNFIAYSKTNVNIIGAHAGISVGRMERLTKRPKTSPLCEFCPICGFFAPCDAIESKKATVAAAKIWGPDYLRFTREKTPVLPLKQRPLFPVKRKFSGNHQNRNALLLVADLWFTTLCWPPGN